VSLKLFILPAASEGRHSSVSGLFTGLAQVGKLKESMGHTFKSINFNYTMSPLADTQLLDIDLFLVGESLCTSSLCLPE
jgi:hypothetical protein